MLLNVTAMRAGVHVLLALKSVLAALYMAHGALLHFLRIMTGVFHILVTELALHDSLLTGVFQANVIGKVMFRFPGAPSCKKPHPTSAVEISGQPKAKLREDVEYDHRD
jgi:hypothetical protein